MIYIYYPATNSFGVNVIIEKFIEVCNKENVHCKYITDLNEVSISDVIIPYGVDCAVELIDKGYDTKLCFMIDALTLGYLNKIKFYCTHNMMFQYDFFRSIYVYFKDILKEVKVIKNYDKVMLVSQTDIEYLKKLSNHNVKYICIPNGAEIVRCTPKESSDHLRLGILSSWNERVSYRENDWFIQCIYKQYYKEHPDTVLYIAGRGKFAENYIGKPGIKYIGEVDDLDEFFINLDVFIAANPKGCGILNRVLDAFRYKTIVLGYDKSFSGFQYMRDSYFSFRDYESFENELDFIKNNVTIVDKYIENAYEYIMKYNNWEKNYHYLISQIDKL
jgi:glycosyltransferase involved in cell wall biosynthesis